MHTNIIKLPVIKFYSKHRVSFSYFWSNVIFYRTAYCILKPYTEEGKSFNSCSVPQRPSQIEKLIYFSLIILIDIVFTLAAFVEAVSRNRSNKRKKFMLMYSWVSLLHACYNICENVAVITLIALTFHHAYKFWLFFQIQ